MQGLFCQCGRQGGASGAVRLGRRVQVEAGHGGLAIGTREFVARVVGVRRDRLGGRGRGWGAGFAGSRRDSIRCGRWGWIRFPDRLADSCGPGLDRPWVEGIGSPPHVSACPQGKRHNTAREFQGSR